MAGGLVAHMQTDDEPTSRAPSEPFAVAVARALLAIVAAAGCLLPWERLEVTPPSDATTTPLDGLHGWGILACLGAAAAILSVAERAWRPSPAVLRDAVCAVAGAGLVAGAALFQLWGGYPVGSSVGGQSRVALAPGLPIAGGAGLLLFGLSLARLWSQRAASRRQASDGER